MLQDLRLPGLGGRFTPKSPPIPDRLRPYWAQSLVNPVCVKTYASGVLPLAGPPKLNWSRVTGHTGVSPWWSLWDWRPMSMECHPWWSLCVWRPMPVECFPWQVHLSWIGRGWQAILGSVPGETCVSEDLRHWSVTPGRSTQAGLVEGDRSYWGQSLVSLCVWRPMPVECYSWQVHPSWIGRGWQAILGSVLSEACVSEDLCKWSVTPGRSTKAGLVEGDRSYWGQSLVKPVCLKNYGSGVLLLAGPPKLDWSRGTGHTGDSRWPSRLRV